MKKVKIYIKEEGFLPKYATVNSSGVDLCSIENLTINPGDRALVKTGLQMVIPEGYEGQVRPRSGLALKYGVTVLNTPGTVDSDYRGEVKVILINLSKEPFDVVYGDRIAQLVFAPVKQVKLQRVTSEEFDKEATSRGTGGFGSTGV